MELLIHNVQVCDVKPDVQTKVEDGVLSVNKTELRDLLMDKNTFKDVEIEIVHPSENVRIVKINDVVEPRAKVDPDFPDFPGSLGEIKTAGRGITVALKGVSVILIDQMPKREIEFVDMSGLGSELSIYGKLNNIIVNPIPLSGVDWENYQFASKIAMLKTAVYLARSTENERPIKTESYKLNLPIDRDMHVHKNLPRIAYYFQMHAKQFSLGDREPIFYGHNLKGILPTAVHPNEVLDGAVLRGYLGGSMETYLIQNNAVIKRLYSKHGKEILFAGVVAGVSSIDENERERAALVAGNIMSNVLGAEGVILTKAYGGAPHTDLERTAEVCEEIGLKTVLLIQVLTEETSLEEAVLIGSDKLDALVNTGFFNERVTFPGVERIIGGLPSDLIEGQPATGEITTRLRLLAGATSQLGESNMIAVQY
jgi:glycine reductase